MPAPIALSPLAWTALRYGALTALALYAARSRVSQPKDALHEHMLDALPEGMVARPHRAEGESALHGHGRVRRVVRLGRGGPGVEIEAAALGRFRFRRVD
jgi:hypothetical protein